MTREDIKKIFPDATDEQITNMLNSHNTEKNAEKAAASKAADKGISDDELSELRKKAKAFDDAEKEKMTAEEKLKAALEEAEKAKTEAIRVRARTKAEAEFIKAGLTETEYKDILDDVVADDDEKTLARVARLTKIIKDKTEAAIKTTKEEILKDSSQPQSGSGNAGGKSDEQAKSDAEKLAKSLAADYASAKSYEDTMNYYK